MNCVNCQAQLNDGSTFCTVCGAKQPVAGAANQINFDQQPASSEIPPTVMPFGGNEIPPTVMPYGDQVQPNMQQFEAQPVPQQQYNQAAPQQQYNQSAPQQQYNQVNMQQQYEQPPVQMVTRMEAPKKKSKAPMIILIVLAAVLLFGGAFAGYWFTRPIYKVEKALEVNDLDVITKYYGKLKAEDQNMVSSKMVTYCEKLADSYVEEDMEYEEVREIYDRLAQEVLLGNSEYEKISDEVDALKASRDAYKAGIDAMGTMDYDVAIEEFGKVIEEDENYQDAQDKIMECKALNLQGAWQSELDAGEFLGLFIKNQTSVKPDFSFPMYMVLKFKEDGKGEISLEVKDKEKSMEAFIDATVDAYVSMYAAQYNISADQLNILLKARYGVSLTEYVKQYIIGSGSVDEILDEFEQSQDFTYEIDGDTVTITMSNGSNDTLIIGDETLTLDMKDSSAWQYYFQVDTVEFTKRADVQ